VSAGEVPARALRVADWLARPERPLCLDLRAAADFAPAHLPGAGNLPLAELSVESPALPRSGTPLYLVGGEAVPAALARLAARARWPLFYSLEAPADWPAAALVAGPPAALWRPNGWLAAHWQQLPPSGRVLDLAMGSGRDAVWLAQRGFRVTGLDILPDAIARARALAARHGVALETRVADALGADALAPGDWDGILVVNFLERALLPRLPGALAAGGVLIYQSFTHPQASNGRPRDPRRLLAPGELSAAFAESLEPIASHEGELEPGRRTASLVARRAARANT